MAKPASPSTEKNNSKPSTHSPSQYKPSTSVFLEQWWLIKAQKEVDGKRLAVAGFTHQGQKGTWIFFSDPIVKKHDMFTLEAADGVMVFINGAIDIIRSHGNGFTSEVCDHFLIGFPYDWDNSRYHHAEESILSNISCLSFDPGNIKDGSSRDQSFKKSGDASEDPVLQENAESSGHVQHATETGSLPTSISCLLNERDNVEYVFSEKNPFEEKLDAVYQCPVLQVNGECSGPAEVEVHRTENEIGITENVSSASCGKMNSKKKSVSPLKTRRSSRLINVKRVTDNDETAQDKGASLGSELVSGEVIYCTSGGKDGAESRAELHEKTNHFSKCNVLGITPINPRVSVNCGDDIAENDTTLDHLIEVGPGNLGEENFNICSLDEQGSVANGGFDQNPPKEKLDNVSSDPVLQVNAEVSGPADVELNPTQTEEGNETGRIEILSSASCGKMSSKKESTFSLKTRRSGRLINVKQATGKKETAKSKGNTASLGSHVVTEDVVDCASGGKYCAESRVEVHVKTSDFFNCNLIGISPVNPIVSDNCGDDNTQNGMADDHPTEVGFENLAGENLNRCLLNDQDNVKNSGFKDYSSKEKLVNTPEEPVLQVNAEILDITCNELYTTEIGTDNEISRTENLSSASCGQTNSKKESKSPRRSSRLINVKTATDCKKTANKVITGKLDADLVTGDNIDCRSGVKDGSESRVEPDERTSHLSKHNLPGIQPSDPIVSTNCCDDITKKGTIKDHLKAGPENLGEERLIRCSSKAVASSDKINNTNKPAGPYEARRSSRLKITKDGINSGQEISKSLCSDLLGSAAHEKGPVSRGEDHWDTSSDESGETMCESSLEADSQDNKLEESQSKAKRRLDFVTDAQSVPTTKGRNNILSLVPHDPSLVPPEESGCKRSRSGRVVIPPLDYWRNQRAIYDMGRGCVGVQNGLSLAESLTGTKSGHVRKKQKLI